MKLISLEAQNVKRLKAVSITFNGKSAIIGGDNGAGKSSTLDAIEMALGGARSIPAEPIRKGEQSARVVLDLEDIIVTREFSDGGGTTLVVKAKDGSKISSPQKLIDELTGRTMRDPLAFTRLEPKAQLKLLKELVGLDTAGLDAERQKLYDDRTEAGRDYTGRKNQLDAMPEWPEAGTVEKTPEQATPKLKTTAELAKQLDAARDHNQKRADVVESCNGFRAEIRQAEADIAKAKAQIDTWTKMLAKAEHAKAGLVKDLAQEEKAADAIKPVDTDPIIAAIAAVEGENQNELVETARLNSEAYAAARAHNAKVQANIAKRDMTDLFRQCKEAYDDLTEKIEAIDKEKAALLAKATFPVKGLGFGLQGVTYKDLPFEQASSAEQLRVSTAIALALCPDRPDAIKLLLVRDGSLLDDQSLEAMLKQVADSQGVVIIERVGKGSEVTVVIEDGMVKKGK